MAHIRAHNTTQRNRRKGKPVKRYEVVWREHATDPTTGLPTGKQRSRQESYPTREAAEARRDELNAAKHTATGTTALADAKKAGELPFGHYAQGWLARQRTKVADGRLKLRTCERYEGTVRYNLLPCFGSRPIGAITLLDCEQFRADLASRRSSRTVRNVWQVLRHVLRYAYEHNAITAVPTDAIDRTTARYAVGDDTGFEPHPLTAPQVAALAAKVGERYPVYELLVLFMAYTGLRAAEVQGLEVRDLVLTSGPDGTVKGSVRVQRTKARRKREWITGTPKSKTSKRTVPLPAWLAARLADYLAIRLHRVCITHPHTDTPTAVLWPRRLQGNHVVKPPLDWSAPLDLNGLQSKIVRPALEAIGLPASRPARTADRWHRTSRHQGCSAARPSAHGGGAVADRRRALHPGSEVARAQQLRADPDDVRRLHPRAETENPLPEPVAPRRQTTNVVTLLLARARHSPCRDHVVLHPDTTAALSYRERWSGPGRTASPDHSQEGYKEWP